MNIQVQKLSTWCSSFLKVRGKKKKNVQLPFCTHVALKTSWKKIKVERRKGKKGGGGEKGKREKEKKGKKRGGKEKKGKD